MPPLAGPGGVTVARNRRMATREDVAARAGTLPQTTEFLQNRE